MRRFRRKRQGEPVDYYRATQDLRMTLIEHALTGTPEYWKMPPEQRRKADALAAAIRASHEKMEALAEGYEAAKASGERVGSLVDYIEAARASDELEAAVDHINQTPGARIFLELDDRDD